GGRRGHRGRARHGGGGEIPGGVDVAERPGDALRATRRAIDLVHADDRARLRRGRGAVLACEQGGGRGGGRAVRRGLDLVGRVRDTADVDGHDDQAEERQQPDGEECHRDAGLLAAIAHQSTPTAPEKSRGRVTSLGFSCVWTSPRVNGPRSVGSGSVLACWGFIGVTSFGVTTTTSSVVSFV